MKMLLNLLAGAALAACLATASSAGAMLTVVFPNQSGETESHEFSEDELGALTQTRYATSTEFTDGVPEFSGPLARDVLDAVGAGEATTAVMTAANDYSVEIPIDELRRYDVIFATSMDGKRLSRRDKGPIWVMYPLDRHEELQDPVFNGRLIWQMVRVELK